MALGAAAAQQRQEGEQAAGGGIELRQLLQLQRRHRLAREVAGADQLDLAVDRLGVDELGTLVTARGGGGAGVIGFLILDDHPRFRNVARLDDEAERQSRRGAAGGGAGDQPLAPRQRR